MLPLDTPFLFHSDWVSTPQKNTEAASTFGEYAN
jgi:hypothetical protein